MTTTSLTPSRSLYSCIWLGCADGVPVFVDLLYYLKVGFFAVLVDKGNGATEGHVTDVFVVADNVEECEILIVVSSSRVFVVIYSHPGLPPPLLLVIAIKHGQAIDA